MINLFFYQYLHSVHIAAEWFQWRTFSSSLTQSIIGSTFSKTKPQVPWLYITRKAFARVLFFPFYYKWYALYICQSFCWFKFKNNNSVVTPFFKSIHRLVPNDSKDNWRFLFLWILNPSSCKAETTKLWIFWTKNISKG